MAEGREREKSLSVNEDSADFTSGPLGSSRLKGTSQMCVEETPCCDAPSSSDGNDK